VIAAAILIGLGISFTAIDPISLLVWSAVLNGIAAVPLIVVVGRIAAHAKVMGTQRSSTTSKAVIGVTAVAMTIAAAATVMGLVAGH
jgi:Mn2+/Fe2+ NRAMP family transporter